MGRGTRSYSTYRSPFQLEMMIRLGDRRQPRRYIDVGPIVADAERLIRELIRGAQVEPPRPELITVLIGLHDADAPEIGRRLATWAAGAGAAATMKRIGMVRNRLVPVSADTLLLLERLDEARYQLSAAWPPELSRNILEAAAALTGRPLDRSTRRDSPGE